MNNDLTVLIVEDDPHVLLGCQQALALEQAGDYTGAIRLYGDIPLYKDSMDRITACQEAILEEKYQAALALEQAGRYEEAIAAYKEIPGHKDSANRIIAFAASVA